MFRPGPHGLGGRNRRGYRSALQRSTGFPARVILLEMTRCYDTRVKRSVPTLILLLCSYLALAQDLVRKPVEEVVAVIDRTPLLASDIDLAEVLVLIDRPFSANDADYRSALLDARIQLEVQFRDLESSGVLYRLDLDVIGVRRNLLDNVGGLEALSPTLTAAGLTEADVDELALRICAVNAFADQRLRPRVSVSMQEIETAYRRLAVEIESQGESAPLLTSVQEQLHRLVAERKLNDEIERWVARALEEREVTRFVR